MLNIGIVLEIQNSKVNKEWLIFTLKYLNIHQCYIECVAHNTAHILYFADPFKSNIGAKF